jgi:hypothetical protein
MKIDQAFNLIALTAVILQFLRSKKMEIVSGQVGPEVKYELKFENAALCFEIKRVGGMGDEEGMYGKLPALAVVAALVDAIEKAIPGDQAAEAAMVKAFLMANLPK